EESAGRCGVGVGHAQDVLDIGRSGGKYPPMTIDATPVQNLDQQLGVVLVEEGEHAAGGVERRGGADADRAVGAGAPIDLEGKAAAEAQGGAAGAAGRSR